MSQLFALIEIDRLGVKRDKKDKYSSVFSLSSFQHYNPPVHNTLILYPNQSTLASMVLCLICWGVYTGVKKAQKTIEQKKERKRLANGEKEATHLTAAEEKAQLAAAASTTTCEHEHGEDARSCEACKRRLAEEEQEGEVPPPYVEKVSDEGGSGAATTSVVRAS
ncbi:hypothetical protein P389DRAFT_171885 [Cystobasidium minutum MCA 4210]|uniref:uncharacterized protein n=1 Tax=Cystobasidium minutum MCA 4210 TaxID=1397322 RepID=UPI0034CEDD08|eukprot:jgi/Rhomi1/171885/fgenesh1_kg.4_\